MTPPQHYSRMVGLPPAMILAGGFGTRLRPVVDDRPKPMAAVVDRPFLDHLLRQLRAQDIHEIVMLTHYLGDIIEHYFGTGKNWGLTIRYIRDPKPLGTGGAVIHALHKLNWTGPFFLLNGDSFIDVDLNDFYRSVADNIGGLVLTRQSTPGKYGAITLRQDDTVERFSEKAPSAKGGLVNAGCYFLHPELFANRKATVCSLETDLFPEWIATHRLIKGYVCNGYFVDIGTPEDYRKFQDYMKQRGNV